MKVNGTTRYGLCIRNDDCEDLELRKVYPMLKDTKAEGEGYVRVIDESGEDYLYPESFFVPIRLPQATQKTILAMAS
jgi:hypothetical protein